LRSDRDMRSQRNSRNERNMGSSARTASSPLMPTESWGEAWDSAEEGHAEWLQAASMPQFSRNDNANKGAARTDITQQQSTQGRRQRQQELSPPEETWFGFGSGGGIEAAERALGESARRALQSGPKTGSARAGEHDDRGRPLELGHVGVGVVDRLVDRFGDAITGAGSTSKSGPRYNAQSIGTASRGLQGTTYSSGSRGMTDRDPFEGAPAANEDDIVDDDGARAKGRREQRATPAEARGFLRQMRHTGGVAGAVLRAAERVAGSLEGNIARDLAAREREQRRSLGVTPELERFEAINPWAARRERESEQRLQGLGSTGSSEGLEQPSREHWTAYHEDAFLRQYPQSRDAVSGTWIPFPTERDPRERSWSGMPLSKSQSRDSASMSDREQTSSTTSKGTKWTDMPPERRSELDRERRSEIEGVSPAVAARLRAMFDEGTIDSLRAVDAGMDDEKALFDRTPRRDGTPRGLLRENEKQQQQRKSDKGSKREEAEERWDMADLP